ncbi:histone-lysine N-methyltransferase SETD2 [Protopterus annectens]|uniref:histone-lysine N-methyltransferase SETD2 n=1 Tax=Protopterus annectens TaxID=7888 RepID=UPI001CFA9053|nr:histone-lysine N-methyltransferase SETD2 [Protopterus annectens]
MGDFYDPEHPTEERIWNALEEKSREEEANEGKVENVLDSKLVKIPVQKSVSSSRFLPKGTKTKVNLEEQGRQKVSFSFSVTKKPLQNWLLSALSGEKNQNDASGSLSLQGSLQTTSAGTSETNSISPPKPKLEVGKLPSKKHLLSSSAKAGVGVASASEAVTDKLGSLTIPADGVMPVAVKSDTSTPKTFSASFEFTEMMVLPDLDDIPLPPSPPPPLTVPSYVSRSSVVTTQVKAPTVPAPVAATPPHTVLETFSLLSKTNEIVEEAVQMLKEADTVLLDSSDLESKNDDLNSSDDEVLNISEYNIASPQDDYSHIGTDELSEDLKNISSCIEKQFPKRKSSHSDGGLYDSDSDDSVQTTSSQSSQELKHLASTEKDRDYQKITTQKSDDSGKKFSSRSKMEKDERYYSYSKSEKDCKYVSSRSRSERDRRRSRSRSRSRSDKWSGKSYSRSDRSHYYESERRHHRSSPHRERSKYPRSYAESRARDSSDSEEEHRRTHSRSSDSRRTSHSSSYRDSRTSAYSKSDRDGKEQSYTESEKRTRSYSKSERESQRTSERDSSKRYSPHNDVEQRKLSSYSRADSSVSSSHYRSHTLKSSSQRPDKKKFSSSSSSSSESDEDLKLPLKSVESDKMCYSLKTKKVETAPIKKADSAVDLEKSPSENLMPSQIKETFPYKESFEIGAKTVGLKLKKHTELEKHTELDIQGVKGESGSSPSLEDNQLAVSHRDFDIKSSLSVENVNLIEICPETESFLSSVKTSNSGSFSEENFCEVQMSKLHTFYEDKSLHTKRPEHMVLNLGYSPSSSDESESSVSSNLDECEASSPLYEDAADSSTCSKQEECLPSPLKAKDVELNLSCVSDTVDSTFCEREVDMDIESSDEKSIEEFSVNVAVEHFPVSHDATLIEEKMSVELLEQKTDKRHLDPSSCEYSQLLSKGISEVQASKGFSFAELKVGSSSSESLHEETFLPHLGSHSEKPLLSPSSVKVEVSEELKPEFHLPELEVSAKLEQTAKHLQLTEMKPLPSLCKVEQEEVINDYSNSAERCLNQFSDVTPLKEQDGVSCVTPATVEGLVTSTHIEAREKAKVKVETNPEELNCDPSFQVVKTEVCAGDVSSDLTESRSEQGSEESDVENSYSDSDDSIPRNRLHSVVVVPKNSTLTLDENCSSPLNSNNTGHLSNSEVNQQSNNSEDEKLESKTIENDLQKEHQNDVHVSPFDEFDERMEISDNEICTEKGQMIESVSQLENINAGCISEAETTSQAANEHCSNSEEPLSQVLPLQQLVKSHIENRDLPSDGLQAIQNKLLLPQENSFEIPGVRQRESRFGDHQNSEEALDSVQRALSEDQENYAQKPDDKQLKFLSEDHENSAEKSDSMQLKYLSASQENSAEETDPDKLKSCFEDPENSSEKSDTEKVELSENKQCVTEKAGSKNEVLKLEDQQNSCDSVAGCGVSQTESPLNSTEKHSTEQAKSCSAQSFHDSADFTKLDGLHSTDDLGGLGWDFSQPEKPSSTYQPPDSSYEPHQKMSGEPHLESENSYWQGNRYWDQGPDSKSLGSGFESSQPPFLDDQGQMHPDSLTDDYEDDEVWTDVPSRTANSVDSKKPGSVQAHEISSNSNKEAPSVSEEKVNKIDHLGQEPQQLQQKLSASESDLTAEVKMKEDEHDYKPLVETTKFIGPCYDMDDFRDAQHWKEQFKLKKMPPYFELIEENVYLTERKKCKSHRDIKRMQCECPVLTKEERTRDQVACGEDCLNRLLMIECSSRCPNGEYCSNRRFQKKQHAEVEVILTEKKGWGLRAVKDLVPNTFVLEYCGEVLDHKEFKARVKEYARQKNIHYYFMALKNDEIIDATQKGNCSRFMNHSCEPNCETQKWSLNPQSRTGFVESKVISAGSELTFHYQFRVFPKEAQKCFCGSANCRGYLGGENRVSIRAAGGKMKKDRSRKKDSVDGELEALLENGEGLSDQNQVVSLARLMVRIETVDQKLTCLKIIQNTQSQQYLKYFLEFHGLSLFWIWMAELGDSQASSNNTIKLQIEIMKTLEMLPIPNKNMLEESKVLFVIQRWAQTKTVVSQLSEGDGYSSENTSRAQTPLNTPDPVNKQTAEGESDTPKKLVFRRLKIISENSMDSGMSDTSKVSDGELEIKEGKDLEQPESMTHEDDERKTDTEASGDSQLDSADPIAGEMEPEAKESNGIKLDESVAVETPSQDEEEGFSDVESEKSQEPVDKTVDVCEMAIRLLELWKDLKEVYRIPKKTQAEKEASSVTERGKEVPTQRDPVVVPKTPVVNKDREREPEKLTQNKDKKKRKSSPSPPSGYEWGAKRTEERYDATTASKKKAREKDRNKLSTEERRKLFEQEVAQREAQKQQQQQHMQNIGMGSPLPFETMPFSSPHQSYVGYPPGYPMQTYVDPTNPNAGKVLLPTPNMETTCSPMAYEPPPPLPLMTLPVEPVMSTASPSPITPQPISAVPPVPVQMDIPPQPYIPPNEPVIPQEPSVEPLQVPGAGQVLGQSYGTWESSHQTVPVQQQYSGVQPQPPIYFQGQTIPPLYGITPPYAQTTQPIVQPPVGSIGSSGIDVGSRNNQAEYLLPNVPLMEMRSGTPPGMQSYGQPGMPYIPGQQMYPPHPQGVVMQPAAVAPILPAEQPQAVQQELIVTNSATDLPPPSPPQPKTIVLPLNWKTAKDPEGKIYYYHMITRQTQWDPPSWDEATEESGMDHEAEMDLGTPTYDEMPTKEITVTSDGNMEGTPNAAQTPVKAKTAEADTSSELAKRSKELFRKEMSQFIVHCLNPYRKPDCKVGRITTTEEFKHLARKLTHGVMNKELRYCKNPEDLECNENVKYKTREYIRKYMQKFGPFYRPKEDMEIE